MKTSQFIATFCILFAQLGCSTMSAKKTFSETERAPAGNTDIVRLIGAERTSENLKNEEIVGRSILSLRENFQYCYERALNTNPSLNSELLFYFSINQKENFQYITSESIPSGAGTTELAQCISLALSKLKAPRMNQNLTYRVRLRLQNAQ